MSWIPASIKRQCSATDCFSFPVFLLLSLLKTHSKWVVTMNCAIKGQQTHKLQGAQFTTLMWSLHTCAQNFRSMRSPKSSELSRGQMKVHAIVVAREEKHRYFDTTRWLPRELNIAPSPNQVLHLISITLHVNTFPLQLQLLEGALL